MLYHILSYENSNLLRIDNIGFSSDPKICRFGPGQREIYIIHYVLSGEGYFNGTLLKAGQGFLITPNMPEHYYPNENSPWKLLWITSRDPNIAEIFTAYDANPATNVFTYNYVSTANDLTATLKQKHNVIYSASEMLEIFLSLFNHQKTTSAFSGNADMYYSYALDYVSSNMFKQVSVNELTEVLGISQPYLYRIFKKHCGMSPQRKINELKTDKAKKLLAQESMSVTSIAYSLGFSTPQDFSKFFRKTVGKSPTEYRSSHSSGD